MSVAPRGRPRCLTIRNKGAGSADALSCPTRGALAFTAVLAIAGVPGQGVYAAKSVPFEATVSGSVTGRFANATGSGTGFTLVDHLEIFVKRLDGTIVLDR